MSDSQLQGAPRAAMPHLAAPPDCVAWQCAQFAAALQVLGSAPEAVAVARLRHSLRAPPELPADQWPQWRDTFVQFMVDGAHERRALTAKILAMRETRASFVDGHLPMTVLLVGAFGQALAHLPAPLRELFVREVQAGVPAAAPGRLLASLT